MERAGYYFQNWDSLLDQVARQGPRHHRRAGGAALREAAGRSCRSSGSSTSGKGKDGYRALLESYDRSIQLAYQTWQYHFEFLNLGYIAYLDFFSFCKQAFPDIPDQAIATMVQGVDVELFRPDDELKKLAKLAVRARRCRPRFGNTDDVEATLARGRRGRRTATEWIAACEAAQDPWFNFTVRQRLLLPPTSTGTSTWRSRWATSADYIRRVEEGEEIMRPVAELVAERDRIIDGIPRAARRRQPAPPSTPSAAWPRTVLPLRGEPQLLHRALDDGRLLAQDPRAQPHARTRPGFWTEARRHVLPDAATRSATRCSTWCTGWGVGAEPIGPAYWPAEIERRRDDRGRAGDRRPAAGAERRRRQSITEPFTLMLWGITTEQVRQWLGAGEAAEGGGLQRHGGLARRRRRAGRG